MFLFTNTKIGVAPYCLSKLNHNVVGCVIENTKERVSIVESNLNPTNRRFDSRIMTTDIFFPNMLKTNSILWQNLDTFDSRLFNAESFCDQELIIFEVNYLDEARIIYPLRKLAFPYHPYIKTIVLTGLQCGSVHNQKKIFLIVSKRPFSESIDIEETSRTVRDCIYDSKKTLLHFYRYTESRIEQISNIPQGSNFTSLSLSDQKKYCKTKAGATSQNTGVGRRVHADKICPTLAAYPASKMVETIHPFENRPLAIEEYLRIQGLPFDYDINKIVLRKYIDVAYSISFEMANYIFASIKEYYINNYSLTIGI